MTDRSPIERAVMDAQSHARLCAKISHYRAYSLGGTKQKVRAQRSAAAASQHARDMYAQAKALGVFGPVYRPGPFELCPDGWRLRGAQ